MSYVGDEVNEAMNAAFLESLVNVLERHDGRAGARKTRHVRKSVAVVQLSISDIRPSPENDALYRPVLPKDVVDLAESIRQFGVREPLVVSADDYIISGHRRFIASSQVGLAEVPCIVNPLRRSDDHDGFVRLLREHNRQRVKSRDELFREELISVNPAQAYAALQESRRSKSKANPAAAFQIKGQKQRARISDAKLPMLKAVQAVLDDRLAFWPLSVRQVHYALLNDPPLRHASKSRSAYANDRASYQDLCDVLTRARLSGDVDMHAIEDETRPVEVWPVHPNVQAYTRDALDRFLRTYWRDLMRSQPDHVEIVVEKNTIRSIVEPIAREFTIPLTSGRGYCSLPPRAAMAERFQGSGKNKLVLLLLSDFDPDGDEIAESFARSMRDDFLIEDTLPIRVALTEEQVAKYKLPPVMKAKNTSAHYGKFVDKHGENVFELEALEPATLQSIVREAIESVIDMDAFETERKAEAEDAKFLEARRLQVCRLMAEIDPANEEANS